MKAGEVPLLISEVSILAVQPKLTHKILIDSIEIKNARKNSTFLFLTVQRLGIYRASVRVGAAVLRGLSPFASLHR